MKLVLIVPGFPRMSETFIVSKFLSLLEAGFDVHVFCGESKAADWEKFADLKSHHRQRVHARLPLQKGLVLALLPFVLLYGLLRQPKGTLHYLKNGWKRFGMGVFHHFYLDFPLVLLQPDLVHVEFGTLARDRLHLPDLLGCKLISSFRGFDLNYVGLDQPGYYEELWGAVDGLHLLGEDLWKRAQRRGCPPDKLHALISPAINLDFFRPDPRPVEEAGTPERPLRILSVGRAEWKKGYEYALQAVRELVDAGVTVEYRIVGAGNMMNGLAFTRHHLRLDEVVDLMGGQPREIVRDQMQWADIFLHAAVSEGFCNAVIEAQAMELPVVTSDADGLGENVADGITGFVVPRRDAHALADKLLRLAQDSNLRVQMGKAGRERVTNCFDLRQHAAQFVELYERVMAAS